MIVIFDSELSKLCSLGLRLMNCSMLINDKVYPVLTFFLYFHGRIYDTRIVGNVFDVIIINCFTSTEEKCEDIKINFYEELESF